jgi:sulfur-carrier protein
MGALCGAGRIGKPGFAFLHGPAHKGTLCNMVTVSFAPTLQRHHACPVQQVGGTCLAEVLNAALAAQPALKPYVLDDQGHIRKHVAVFVGERMHLPRNDLSRPVADGTRVLVAQCLTGG